MHTGPGHRGISIWGPTISEWAESEIRSERRLINRVLVSRSARSFPTINEQSIKKLIGRSTAGAN